MTIGNLRLYDIFRTDLHLPDAKAMELVNAMDEHYERKSFAKTDHLATKTELTAAKSELKEDIGKVRAELKEDISKVRVELKEDISKVRSELKQDISNVRSELKEEISKVRVELKVEMKDTENRLMKHMHSVTIIQYILLIGSIAALLRYAGILK
ncbi:hypothetical protein [Chitinophaga sp.]|uniref:hypothetical protein n=1 Tax=Chitinophaga sp. TaxID=1869181 RepID=UPI002F922E4A